MITAKDIVTEIEKLGDHLSRLSAEENSNLTLNLGLSNLGIEYGQRKFQDLYAKVLSGLREVLEEYRERAITTEWDLGFVLEPVKSAVSLILEIDKNLSESPYKVLDSANYQESFKVILMPFEKLRWHNSLDPRRISFYSGGDYSKDLHGEIEDVPADSENALVRINQFITLLETIVDGMEFRINLLEGDRKELLSDLAIVNATGNLKTSYGLEYGGHEGSDSSNSNKTGPWSKESLPLDGYYDKLLKEFEAIDIMYLNVNPENANWEDVLNHFHCLFNADYVHNIQDLFKESELISHYEGLESGLRDLQSLEAEYNDWFSRFAHLRSIENQL